MKKKAILSVIGKIKGFVRSVSGTPPIALEACADNMSIIDYKIHGNSIQDGTPSPDNPIEVQSVGKKTKNLFDEELLLSNSNATKTDDGYKLAGYPVIYDSSSSLIKHIKSVLKPNVTYTLSRRFSGYKSDNIGAIWIRNSSANLVQVPFGGGIKSAKFTFTQEQIDSIANIYIYGRNTNNLNGIFNYIQLEEGSVATDYEPYGKYKIPVTARSKNLFDVDYYMTYNKEQETIRGDTKFSDNFWKNDDGNGFTVKNLAYVGKYNNYPLTLKENTQYTLSFEAEWLSTDSRAYFGIMIRYEDNTYKTVIIYFSDTKQKYTLTSETNKTVGGIQIYIWQYNGTCKISNIQLEEGAAATDYEPYHEPITTNIYLDEPLRKVGDYADYIDFKNSMVVRNTNKYIFNGSENWVLTDAQPQVNTLRCSVAFTPICKMNTAQYIKSNLLNCVSLANIDEENMFFALITNISYIALRINRSRLSTEDTAGFKKFLQELYSNDTPFMIYYPLAVPIETSISLPILPTLKGITTVYEVGTTIQPSNMEAEYYSTLKGE